MTIQEGLAQVIRQSDRDWWNRVDAAQPYSQEAFQALAVSAYVAARLRERAKASFNDFVEIELNAAADELDPPKPEEEKPGRSEP